MVSAGDFRNGVTFEMDGQVYQIVEFQHVKPGKGAAFVRAKIKNVIQGSVVERTFNPTEKFPTAFIERKDMVYSYNDSGLYYFMDQETFDMIPVAEADLSDNFKFVKENDICRILSYKGNVFGVEPPTFVTLEVTKPIPALRATPPQTLLNPPLLKQARKSAFRFSLTRAIRFAWTQEPANIWKEHKHNIYCKII